MPIRKSNAKAKPRTKLGMTLEQSAEEILAHVKGDVRLPTRRIVLPYEVEVKRIRTKARSHARRLVRPERVSHRRILPLPRPSEKHRSHCRLSPAPRSLQ